MENIDVLTDNFIWVISYLIGTLLFSNFITNRIIGYSNGYNCYISYTAVIFLNINHKKLETYGKLFFPLVLCFMYGAFWGDKVYEILTENKHENRIASWVF